MLAKLDNFGPFQFFFTLSCTDLRWNGNFAATLIKREITVRHIIEEDKDGYPCTTVYVDYKKDGKLHSEKIKE